MCETCVIHDAAGDTCHAQKGVSQLHVSFNRKLQRSRRVDRIAQQTSKAEYFGNMQSFVIFHFISHFLSTTRLNNHYPNLIISNASKIMK